MMVMVVVMAKMKIKCSKLDKEEREKIKWVQGKGIFSRAILFCHSRYHRGCEWI
jgi:hypothetical protein